MDEAVQGHHHQQGAEEAHAGDWAIANSEAKSRPVEIHDDGGSHEANDGRSHRRPVPQQDVAHQDVEALVQGGARARCDYAISRQVVFGLGGVVAETAKTEHSISPDLRMVASTSH